MLLGNSGHDPLDSSINSILKSLLQRSISMGNVDHQTAQILFNEIQNYLPQIKTHISQNYPNGISTTDLENILRQVINEVFNVLSSQMTAQNTGIIQTQPIFSGNRTSIFGRNRTSIFSNPVSSSGILNTGNVFGTPNYDVSTDKSNNTNSQLSERTNQFASSIAVNVSKDTVTKTHKLFQNNTTPSVNKDPEIQFLKSSHTVNTEKYKTILKLEDGTEVLEPTSKDFKILNKNNITLRI
jgi:hypothetical protein